MIRLYLSQKKKDFIYLKFIFKNSPALIVKFTVKIFIINWITIDFYSTQKESLTYQMVDTAFPFIQMNIPIPSNSMRFKFIKFRFNKKQQQNSSQNDWTYFFPWHESDISMKLIKIISYSPWVLTLTFIETLVNCEPGRLGKHPFRMWVFSSHFLFSTILTSPRAPHLCQCEFRAMVALRDLNSFTLTKSL